MIELYINFMIEQIITDSEKLQFNYGWNYFFPIYAYWLILFLFKYLILTMPIWVPINMVMPKVNQAIGAIKK